MDLLGFLRYKWHTYPAVSGAGTCREEFMEDVDWVIIKLRLGWGQTSNQSVDPYATLGLLSVRHTTSEMKQQ